MRRMQISTTTHDAISRGGSVTNEDHTKGKCKSWAYGLKEKPYEPKENPMKPTLRRALRRAGNTSCQD